MRTYLSLFLLFCLLSVSSYGQVSKYSKVKIYTDGEGLRKLAELGVAFDHGEAKKDVYFISDFSAAEVKIIHDSGTKYEVLIDDVSKFYAEQNNVLSSVESSMPTACDKSFIKTPSHFHLGDYAGFFSYDQLMVILDSMQLLYPKLITKRAPIDNTTTSEGRPLYWLRISNNPNVDQTNKTEIFYNALHHAREPVSLSQLIYYMWFLLDNYNTDPEVKGIVDNLEMYFVPCINPDSYIYNQTTNPSGGGMQRKNMRKNSDGSKGVDINRNYDQFWGYDNQGSSNSMSADSYRGPSAGSEPETKMIKNFCIAHHFKFAISCHAYGGYLIHSWGYKASVPAIDNGLFTNYGKFMTEENKYSVGTPSATVGYTGNGASSDWFYAEETVKNKIYEYSPEAGKTSFYPAKNQIIGICKEMFNIEYKMAKLALKYVLVTDAQPYYVKTKTGYFKYNYKSLVPDSLAKFTVTIIPVSASIASVGSPKSYSNTVINTLGKDSISFTLDPAIKEGTLLKYVIKVNNAVFTHSDTVVKMYGNPIIVLNENGNTIDQWVTSTGWGVSSTVYHSPTSSITDSPTGNYANNASTSITTKSEIDLSDTQSALLSFWGKWNIEQGFDYVQLSASTDHGQTWIPLCGKYTSTGTNKQDAGNPIYDGVSDWVREEVNLNAFSGQKIMLRFILKSDGQNAADGFYFDDLLIEKIPSNTNAIEEQDADKAFAAAATPNPANTYTNITFKVDNSIAGDSKLIIYNALGQVFYSEKIATSSGNILLNTSKWPDGIYYYSLQKGKYDSAVNKLCITH
jgi:carboxypeptidase T